MFNLLTCLTNKAWNTMSLLHGHGGMTVISHQAGIALVYLANILPRHASNKSTKSEGSAVMRTSHTTTKSSSVCASVFALGMRLVNRW